MLHEVCRAYHKSPDEIRCWQYRDYLGALESLTETPFVDKAVYLGFFKPQKKTFNLNSPEGRAAFAESMEKAAGNG